MEQGYEVFNNLKQDGPVDLIALDKNTGETILIDVKTAHDTSGKSRSKEQKRLGVRLLYVGNTISWSWSEARGDNGSTA